MRYFLPVIIAVIPVLSFGQTHQVSGPYQGIMSHNTVTFNTDSTFEYQAKDVHPIFYRWEQLNEKGRWTVSGDTIILNPQLSKKLFVESALVEEEVPGDTTLYLTFNHIKRYYDEQGQVIKTDTLQITRLDYAFNENKRKKFTRVAPSRTVRCTFAGHIPKEIITSNRTILVPRPAENINSIFIGCYEQQQTKAFVLQNPKASRLTYTVYSNYYGDGQIRQMKFLIKNDRELYTRQKENGQFEKDTIWSVSYEKLKKQKGRG